MKARCHESGQECRNEPRFFKQYDANANGVLEFTEVRKLASDLSITLGISIDESRLKERASAASATVSSWAPFRNTDIDLCSANLYSSIYVQSGFLQLPRQVKALCLPKSEFLSSFLVQGSFFPSFQGLDTANSSGDAALSLDALCSWLPQLVENQTPPAQRILPAEQAPAVPKGHVEALRRSPRRE